MRAVLYVAHCLRPTSEQIAAGLPRESWIVGLDEWTKRYPGDVKRHEGSCLRRHLEGAMAWLSWLRRSFPETTFIAPWIASVLAGADDADPAQREAGIADVCAVIERCDGIALCGPRISDGMRREMAHGQRRYRILSADVWIPPVEPFLVYDLTQLVDQERALAGKLRQLVPFSEWAEPFRK